MTSFRRLATALALIGSCALTSTSLAAAARTHPDENGNLGPATAPPRVVARPPFNACLRVQVSSASVFYFLVNLQIVTPPTIQITSGTVSGTICQPASWQVTGGSFSGNTLQLTATSSASSLCVTSFAMTGTVSGLMVWTGTSTIGGGPPSPQTTVLLGLGRLTCP